jgi:ATP-dependent HslUV protease subunit HslV
MSVAVVVKKGRRIVMAADSLTTFGGHRQISRNAVTMKIRRVGSALVSCAGWGVYENILDDFLSTRRPPALTTKQSIFRFFMKLWGDLKDKYPFVNEQCSERDSPFGDLDAAFLVANRKGIFKVSSDTSVSEFREYAAIGSGGDYAYGALHCIYDTENDARAIARRAVEAGIEFDAYCGGEVVLQDVP